MGVEQYPQLDRSWSEVTELLGRLKPKIIGYVLKRGLPDPLQAEDLYQEVALLAWKKWNEVVRDHPAREGWIMTATRNLLRAHVREEIKRAKFLAGLSDGAISPPEELSPESVICDRVDVGQAMKSLTSRQLSMVIMHYFEEYSIAEIAECLDVRPGTVKATLSDARKIIRGAYSRLAEGR